MARRVTRARPNVSDNHVFLSFAELAAWLGVSAQRLRAARKEPGFPDSLPFGDGEVWAMRMLERWKRTANSRAFIRKLHCTQTNKTLRALKWYARDKVKPSKAPRDFKFVINLVGSAVQVQFKLR